MGADKIAAKRGDLTQRFGIVPAPAAANKAVRAGRAPRPRFIRFDGTRPVLQRSDDAPGCLDGRRTFEYRAIASKRVAEQSHVGSAVVVIFLVDLELDGLADHGSAPLLK